MINNVGISTTGPPGVGEGTSFLTMGDLPAQPSVPEQMTSTDECSQLLQWRYVERLLAVQHYTLQD